MVFHTIRITLNRCFQIELILHTVATELLQENEDPQRLKGFSLDFRLWCSKIQACNSKRKKKAIENTGSTLIGYHRGREVQSTMSQRIEVNKITKSNLKACKKKAKTDKMACWYLKGHRLLIDETFLTAKTS